jgi:hypothetical protein
LREIRKQEENHLTLNMKSRKFFDPAKLFVIFYQAGIVNEFKFHFQVKLKYYMFEAEILGKYEHRTLAKL